MAFSRFYSYVNDTVSLHPRRSDAALKRYESAKDSRAWSMDRCERSNYIHQIVKSHPRSESSSEDNEASTNQANVIDNIDGMSKEQLLNISKELHREIKIKDVELDKIHKLFKQASKKLEEMNDIVNDNRNVEARLKDSEVKIRKLKEEHKMKDEQIKSMYQEVEELKCGSSVQIDTEQAWKEIKNRSEMLDGVVKERNKLKANLCKMMGISELLRKLRLRADEADEMETEIGRLNRELQRCGYGAAGDNVQKKRAESACKQCDKISDDLSRSESVLNNEIKKNSEVEAERNFLREKVRTSEVVEAEKILYKANYEEAECKILKLKEMLLKADCSEKHVRDLQQQLEQNEYYLKEANRRAEELITNVERLEMEVKERDVYIGTLNRRMQQSSPESSSKKTVSLGCLPQGKVQSIVQKMSYEPLKTNCKCNFENCQCGNMKEKRSNLRSNCSKASEIRVQSNCTAKSSVDTCISAEVATGSRNLELTPNQSCNNINPNSSMTVNEVNRLQEEMSSDEIRLLRQQNAELDQQLKRYKQQLVEITSVMNEVDKQRESNNSLEIEAKNLQWNHEHEMEDTNDTFRSSLCDKDDELCHLKQRLLHELTKIEKLEKKLAVHCKEVKELRCIKDRCHNLEEKLSFAESNETESSKKLQCLQSHCANFCEEKARLIKQIDELKINLEEQQKYAKSLASQLCNRRIQKQKLPAPSDSADNKQTLRKVICDLKKQHEILQKEKTDVTRCYENKLKILRDENETLKCKEKGSNVIKECECKWSTSDGCGDVLLQKASKFGITSLQRDELVDLHNRVRVAMMKLKKITPMGMNRISFDCYTRMADDLRAKYNLSDSLPLMDPEDIPVKDTDMLSTKTLPSVLQNTRRKALIKSENKLRARSTSGVKFGDEATGKCVTITRKLYKK